MVSPRSGRETTAIMMCWRLHNQSSRSPVDTAVIQGYPIRFATVDLTASPADIRSQLQGAVKHAGNAFRAFKPKLKQTVAKAFGRGYTKIRAHLGHALRHGYITHP